MCVSVLALLRKRHRFYSTLFDSLRKEPQNDADAHRHDGRQRLLRRQRRVAVHYHHEPLLPRQV